MKILAIRIKNLASLEGITEIDFTKPPLSTAGIFAITGPTGAGKSTILDALCLALYGRTPRYLEAKEQGIELRDGKNGLINQGDHRGILRDGTGVGSAEVDFIAVDGCAYSAIWRVRRAKDKAEGSMQADSLELKNLDTGISFPGTKKVIASEIERLIGLNFEQFTRSVLLAQGEFTAFLKAGKDDKSSLLEKLTGTQVYSQISQRIFESHKAEEQQLRDLNLKREGILTLTTEELVSLQEKNKAAKEIINLKQKQIVVFDKEINWHHQRKSLGDQLELAVKLVKETNEIKQNFSVRLALFRNVELVQPARKLIDDLGNVVNQLTTKNANLSEIEHALSELNIQLESCVTLIATAAQSCEEKTKEYDDGKPLLAHARALDVKIGGKAEQILDAEKLATIAAGNTLEKASVIRGTKEKSALLVSSVNELQHWKTANEVRQPIAEHETLIISKLSDAQEQLAHSHNLFRQMQGLSDDIAAESKKLESLKVAAEPLKLQLKEKQEHGVQLRAKLSEVDTTKLEAEKLFNDTNLVDLNTAQGHWEILTDRITSFNNIAKRLKADQATHADKLPQLEKATEALGILKTKKETSLQLLQKAQLSVTESVESLRGHLSEGEPCPVCGSNKHPYADHNPQLDAVMQQLEAENKHYEKDYEQELMLCSSLQEKLLHLQKAIESGTEEIAEKESSLNVLKSNWKSYPVYDTIKKIADDNKAEWLLKKTEVVKALQKSLQTQLSTYNTQKKELDELQKQERYFEQQVNENLTVTSKSEQAIEFLKQKLNNSKTDQERFNHSLQQIKTSLEIYFSNEEWFNKWQNDPEAYEENITKFSARWREQIKKLGDDEADLHITRATLEEQEAHLKNFVEEQQSKQTILTGLQQQHKELLRQRQMIFNGAEADQVETTLKAAEEESLQNLECRKASDRNIRTKMVKTGATAEQLKKDLIQLQEQEFAARHNIENWIATFNQKQGLSFDMDKILELLQHTTEWIEEESKILRAMDDAITQTQSVLRERTTRMHEHEKLRFGERNLEELEILRGQANTGMQQATQEQAETQLLLQQDEANRIRIGDLLNAIDAQAIITDNWAKLNDIIGSADGKKFRQIAQEYTLDVLLGYANIHLQSLSQRYLLERIPNTLGLQVLDLDMGNEVRTVFSLSGGESFLVSLALALGLASLSSSRMKVESLFIDEGFGSLDPATLNIAMDALERLHNQGRKVGVISHVQEMTERISTQVKVSKLSNGRSKVEVVTV